MKKKAKEIQQRNREMAKSGRTPGFGSGGGFGSGSYRSGGGSTVTDSGGSMVDPPKPSYNKPRYLFKVLTLHSFFFYSTNICSKVL